jgi:ABC-type amino acid transport substrate-binding protein
MLGNKGLLQYTSLARMQVLAVFLYIGSVFMGSAAYAEKQPFYIGGSISTPLPPYSWVNPCTGDLTGASHDILQRILRQLDLEPVYLPSKPFNPKMAEENLAAIKAGEADSLVAVEPNTRSELLELTQSTIILNKTAVIYLKDQSFEIDSEEDLKGLQGVTPTRKSKGVATHMNRWAEQHQTVLSPVFDLKEALGVVMSGKADYLTTGFYHARVMIDKPIQDRLNIVAMKTLERPLYFAMAKQSQWHYLLPEIDRQLVKSMEEGDFDRLNQKYLLAWVRGDKCTHF